MIWTVAIVDETCGRCSTPIPPDQPMATLTALRKIRCVACAAALGFPLNAAEIDLERFRIEKDRLDVAAISSIGRTPVRRHELRRPMRSSAEMSEELRHVFDPKVAASGDHD